MDVHLPSLLAGLAREHRVPGAQLAVHHAGETVTAETGEETCGTGGPVTRRSAFPLGSLTKPFTATLVMALAAGGDIDLDAPLAEYVPEVGGGGRMTARRLLSHTGGLASNIDEGGDHSEVRRRWVARHCRESDAVHPPGTLFSYSNIGYILAGHLVEVITGMSWWEATEAIILKPLDIAPAFVVGPPSGFRPVVTGHTVQRARDRMLPVTGQTLPKVAAPSAGLALGAADLVTFARMHLGAPSFQAVIDRDSAREMRRDQLAGVTAGPFGMADSWGLGWAIYRDAGPDWFGHDGTGEGTSCHLRFEQAGGTVVALTTNAATGPALWEDLLEELRPGGRAVGGRGLSRPADPGPRAPGPPECAGRYVNGEMEFTVVADGAGGLGLTTNAAERFELTLFEGLRFTMREPAGGRTTYTGRFLRDPGTGEVDLVQVAGRLARRARDGDSAPVAPGASGAGG
ncbi:serine hydrolase domain-containing protein [Streptosporangium sp. NPDC050855]|uniref:serine hydrolase domain-containing protein n=1 Tax=Streptosporangium sp. NPDC050855 TaxID=3366194 RepID=UPI0037AE9ECC